MDMELLGHIFVAVVVGMMGWISTLQGQRFNDLRRRIENIEQALFHGGRREAPR